MMPHVSICIPAYEQPSALCRALESVFEQTYSDFEVIVTDDSASSMVEMALNRWISDRRLKYIRNAKRLGSPENWNAAMSLAAGRLIKVLHHDDWFSGKDSLEKFVSLIEDKREVTFGFSAAFARDSDGRLLFQHTPSDPQITALRKDPRCLFAANFVGVPSATIFRRKQGFRFDPALRWLVDIEAYIRILRDGGAFAYSAKPLINITASAPHQVTREVQANPALQFIENIYVYKLLSLKRMERLKFSLFFFGLARRLQATELETVRTDPKVKHPPFEVRISIWVHKLRLALKRVLTARASVDRLLKRSIAGCKQSYSQCGEDLIIDFCFMWLGRSAITYLDIGANHPTLLNNTYFFYQKGFKGVLVEADVELCHLLATTRPRDRCLNVAVGVDGKPSAKVYIMTSRTLNTLIPSQATQYESYGREKIERVIEVRQRDINDILATEFDRAPNLVSLDVEGLDLEILKHWDFTKFRPEVFCIETLTFTQNGSERKLTEILEFMRSQGYFSYADTYINTIFVSIDVWNARRSNDATATSICLNSKSAAGGTKAFSDLPARWL